MGDHGPSLSTSTSTVPADAAIASVRVFSAAEDPRAAAECVEVLGQGFAVEPGNSFFCPNPALHAERWRGIGTNALLRSPTAPLLHAVGQPPAAVAFAYSYPEHKVPDDAPEPPGIIDLSPISRPEAGPVVGELLGYIAAKKEEFHQAHGPFEYIAFLAVTPARHGNGLGSRLLRFITDKADAAGRWCYLEASNPDNARLYERHGFRQLDSKVWSLESLPGKRFALMPMARPPGAGSNGSDGGDQ